LSFNISLELAEKLVDKTMEILGKNINIMDNRGMIIASGDKKRINSFHEGATCVINQRKVMEIGQEEIHHFVGVQPGINLPIEFNENIVGVVGITGNPEDVRNYGILDKNLVELMIKEAFLTKESQFELRIRNNLIHELLYLMNGSSSGEILAMAEVLDLDLSLSRCVCLIQIEQINTPGYPNGAIEKTYLQQLEDNFIKLVSKLLDSQDLVSFMSPDKLIILKALHDGDNKKALQNLCNMIKKHIAADLRCSCTIGIGSPVSNYFDISSSYEEALKALAIGKKMYGSQSIFIFDDLIWGRLIDSIPSDISQKFLDLIMPEELLSDEKLIKTLRCFIENNLSPGKTSKKLYIHRNTLMYRLNIIQKLTGFDPQLFDNAMLFKLAFIIKDYHNSSSA